MIKTIQNIVFMGGNSAMATYAVPPLRSSGHSVVTMGRKDCDIHWDALGNTCNIPEGTNTAILVAAGFLESTPAEILNTQRINSTGVLNACMTASEAGVKYFIYISSAYTTLPADHPYYNLYTITKRHGEELAQYICKKNRMALCIIRPAPLYDHAGLLKKHNAAPYYFADLAEQNKDITLFGKKNAQRNYLHIDDFTKILQKSVDAQPEGVFSVVCPWQTSLREMAENAISAFGSSSAVKIDETKPDVPDVVLATDEDMNLDEILGLAPTIDMKQGMVAMAEFRRQNT